MLCSNAAQAASYCSREVFSVSRMRGWSATCLRQRRSLYTPDASKCGRAHARFLRALSGTLGAIRRLEGPHGCWIERVSHRYTAFVMTGAPSGSPCPHRYTDRHTRIATGMRGWGWTSAIDTRSPCTRASACPAQSAAPRHSVSRKDRASVTSVSNSKPRPSRASATHLSTASAPARL